MRTVTLRRAAKIRNRLEQRVMELSAQLRQTTVHVNVHDTDILNQLATKEQTYREMFTRYMVASNVLRDLRTRIGQTNIVAGVPELLSQQSALEGQAKSIQTLGSLEDGRPTDEQVVARASAVAERSKTVDSYRDDVDLITFTFISQEMINTAKDATQTIQAELDSIQDQLERINSTTTIPLNDVELSILNNEKIF